MTLPRLPVFKRLDHQELLSPSFNFKNHGQIERCKLPYQTRCMLETFTESSYPITLILLNLLMTWQRRTRNLNGPLDVRKHLTPWKDNSLKNWYYWCPTILNQIWCIKVSTGAVLTQLDSNGDWDPVAFMSKMFTDTERKCFLESITVPNLFNSIHVNLLWCTHQNGSIRGWSKFFVIYGLHQQTNKSTKNLLPDLYAQMQSYQNPCYNLYAQCRATKTSTTTLYAQMQSHQNFQCDFFTVQSHQNSYCDLKQQNNA